MLEKRFYPRQEIAEIVGITDLKDKHFAEKVRRYLDNRKYGYDYSRKGVSITSLPETAEAKLAFLLRDSLGLDNQVDAYDFACFINAFSAIDGFDAMPWITRTAIFNHHYHNNVSKPTLERWHHHLVESGNIVRFAKGALWRTFKDEDGYIVQKRVEPDSQEYQEYCEKRWAYLNGSGFDGADTIWKTRNYMPHTMAITSIQKISFPCIGRVWMLRARKLSGHYISRKKYRISMTCPKSISRLLLPPSFTSWMNTA